ncbi:deoxyribodipyrimidine photo-lyase [Dyadobacter sp. CY312]|uniref:deoxyribodipyrimidine photo-lyase n=1 Tax=Dyadobacter sp. CY312 TaxID=2907303 RepID=UPI001F3C286B|nr:deoxyribodipyrimidine photo-lyase [Dyadobacter sp. CY312]MCE7043656.1 deoxyribodipyrimidine photo-lyase [Dyadobacter sp. CY312]
MAQRIVYWFRNDLRLNDNEAFLSATLTAKEIVPVYVFDPRLFNNTKLGFRRTSALRAQFLIDCVTDLRNRLREKGGDLLIRVGDPEKIVAQLAEMYQAEYVYTSKEIAPEETRIESSLSKQLKVSNIDIKLFWMNTLSQVTDLPFPISKLPLGFNVFHDEVKSNLKVKQPLPEPDQITLPQEYEAGTIVSLPMLGIDPLEISVRSSQAESLHKGGETEAMSALKNYIHAFPTQDENSDDLLTDSALTNWLSVGNLSSRTVYHAISDIRNTDRDGFLKNMLERDYFNWTLLRYGPRMFKPSGVLHNFHHKWLNDKALFNKWEKGQTDDNEVNAIMNKIAATGSISASERLKAANYLIQHDQVNWTWGAMYFESFLTDYNVSVNWGKWNNLAGVGAN